MGHTNRATPEQIAAHGHAPRPAIAAPDGAQNWYRITNAMDPGSENPCLYLYGDIGSWGITAAQCVAELAEIDAPVIDVYISSPGGEAFEGLAIYSALRHHPAKVMVRIDSLAASIASVIAMAGDRVIMSPGSQMMIHDASTAACGDPAELRKCADFLDAQSDNIASIYQERAGGTVKQWRARMVQETWYFADEAVAAGLADEVAKPKRMMPGEDMPDMAAMAASWDLTVYNYAHTSRDDAPAPVLDAASPTHHTATVDSPWDGSVQEKRLPSPMTVATAKAMYGWYDSAQVSGGKIVKAACKLPHHEVSGDGNPGAANLAACRNALARLPQSDIPEAQHAAIQAHLRAHLADGHGSQDRAAWNVAQQFAVGDRIRVTVPPHEEGQDAGTVSEINGNAYGITFDGMEDMGVHRWYVDNELESADGTPDRTPPEAPASPDDAPAAVAAFDPEAFRAATMAALDPMPGYQPDHLRSLMASVADDAPAAPDAIRPDMPYVPPPADTVPEPDEQTVAVAHWDSLFTAVAHDAPAAPAASLQPAPYVPPPADTVPDAAPQDIAVNYWRSLFTAAASDAPAAPARAQPAPTAPEPQVVYVPEPPPPAGQVVADYFRAVMTGVANDAPVPPQPPEPEPTAPEPIPSVDRTAFDRALWEARL